ncbi:MAG TPA: formylglycine-generating enzyme family protein [Bryobacteraceae bacterium]|nr:formylglycine-generating enzyme family protein [Bryobacteraceae bacterium]
MSHDFGGTLLPVILPCCAPTRRHAETLLSSQAASAKRLRVAHGSTENMILLDGGRFLMGSEGPDTIAADGEGPIRNVLLDSYYLDRYPVTNESFHDFVRNTGYETEAEKFGWSFVFAGHLDEDSNTSGRVNGLRWWLKIDGADWRHPEGPDTSLANKETFPVVHVSWTDAAAFAAWAGKRLPTEAEWEFAARAGFEQKRFPWGDDLTPDNQHLCNIWQGEFPYLDTGEDGYAGVAPVDAFPPNRFGFYTITGNVWEWCSDWFSPDHHEMATRVNPIGPLSGKARAMRGGSYLCHASYCNRYRVSARTANTPDSSTTNIGFRCARDK